VRSGVDVREDQLEPDGANSTRSAPALESRSANVWLVTVSVARVTAKDTAGRGEGAHGGEGEVQGLGCGGVRAATAATQPGSTAECTTATSTAHAPPARFPVAFLTCTHATGPRKSRSAVVKVRICGTAAEGWRRMAIAVFSRAVSRGSGTLLDCGAGADGRVPTVSSKRPTLDLSTIPCDVSECGTRSDCAASSAT
jgi:hypothetical protein